jgi:hypothetical protein
MSALADEEFNGSAGVETVELKIDGREPGHPQPRTRLLRDRRNRVFMLRLAIS